VKHGLHRWQQGYRLQELMHEWGHLQLCIFQVVETFAAAHREFERETLMEVNHQMITLVNDAICESAAQFERMQQAEAAGRLSDLEGALASINEIERRRAAFIHEAVHDLNGNVFGVSLAARFLAAPNIAASDRAGFAKLLEKGMMSVFAMLVDLKELARLEAGRETRQISEFDAAELVIKYTVHGGVVMSVGMEKDNWWFMVKDTGPGILAGPGAPMVVGLTEATASARESDEKAASTNGEISHVLVPAARDPAEMRPCNQQPGEGIGLSIVKRLCELLDASLEMASSKERGTTFRVVFPRCY
jgi:hypothetical protein